MLISCYQNIVVLLYYITWTWLARWIFFMYLTHYKPSVLTRFYIVWPVIMTITYLRDQLKLRPTLTVYLDIQSVYGPVVFSTTGFLPVCAIFHEFLAHFARARVSWNYETFSCSREFLIVYISGSSKRHLPPIWWTRRTYMLHRRCARFLLEASTSYTDCCSHV